MGNSNLRFVVAQMSGMGGWEGGPVVRDRASLVAQRVRNLPAMWETQV